MNIYFPMGEIRWSHRKFWDGASAGRGSGPTWVEWTTWLYGFLEEPYYVTYVVKLQGNDETDKATDGRTTSPGDKATKAWHTVPQNRAWITRDQNANRSARPGWKATHHRGRDDARWCGLRSVLATSPLIDMEIPTSRPCPPRFVHGSLEDSSAQIRLPFVETDSDCPVLCFYVGSCWVLQAAAATSIFWESEQQCQQAHLSWVCA